MGFHCNILTWTGLLGDQGGPSLAQQPSLHYEGEVGYHLPKWESGRYNLLLLRGACARAAPAQFLISKYLSLNVGY